MTKGTLPFCLRRGLLAALVLRRDEPDRPLGRIGWRHELAQGLEDFSELLARVAAEGGVFGVRSPLSPTLARAEGKRET